MKRFTLFAAISMAVLVAIADADQCQAESDGCLVAEEAGTCVYENGCNPETDSNCSLVCQTSGGERKKREAKQAQRTLTRKKVGRRL